MENHLRELALEWSGQAGKLEGALEVIRIKLEVASRPEYSDNLQNTVEESLKYIKETLDSIK